VLLALGCLAFAALAFGQTPDKKDPSRPTDAEVREKLQNSGLTPAEIRELARIRGVPEDTIDEYVPGQKSVMPATPSGPPSTLAKPDTSAPPALTPAPPSAAKAPLEPSEFAKELARRVPSAEGVQPFGYDIFSYAPTTFEPLAAGPVDPDYPIGPGDEVIVQVWGDNEFTQTSVVSREATITVPDIGQVVLNGLTLAQAKRLVTDRLAGVYSGIRARRPTTFVDVTLGKLRTIQVFILGDVVRPGGYTISSVSTVLNALYNAGGPTALGSMRDIRIIRHDQIFKKVDLYGYILTGSKAEDVRLQSGDVVFAPPIGRMAAIVGEVHRPAIYELLPGESFHELLRLAGGIQSTALLARVQVDRMVPFAQRDSLAGQDRVALDLPLKDILANPANNPELVDRDIVQVFRVGDVRKNTVAIHGDVVRHPGTYQWRPG
jgi:protein involved in polysaccharide export with SLBB domain